MTSFAIMFSFLLLNTTNAYFNNTSYGCTMTQQTDEHDHRQYQEFIHTAYLVGALTLMLVFMARHPTVKWLIVGDDKPSQRWQRAYRHALRKKQREIHARQQPWSGELDSGIPDYPYVQHQQHHLPTN